jgi:hypothetical protein
MRSQRKDPHWWKRTPLFSEPEQNAKLDAQYAHSEDERRRWAERARAYEAQAHELEESLAGWGREATAGFRG